MTLARAAHNDNLSSVILLKIAQSGSQAGLEYPTITRLLCKQAETMHDITLHVLARSHTRLPSQIYVLRITGIDPMRLHDWSIPSTQ